MNCLIYKNLLIYCRIVVLEIKGTISTVYRLQKQKQNSVQNTNNQDRVRKHTQTYNI